MHTARPMRADRFDVACYALVPAAAVVRVGVPLVAPAWAASQAGPTALANGPVVTSMLRP